MGIGIEHATAILLRAPQDLGFGLAARGPLAGHGIVRLSPTQDGRGLALGNLLGEPRSPLLFIDFERGDPLQLQGMAEIDWSDEAARSMAGAQLLRRFHAVQGWRRWSAALLRWSVIGYAPTTERTAVWSKKDRKAG